LKKNENHFLDLLVESLANFQIRQQLSHAQRGNTTNEI